MSVCLKFIRVLRTLMNCACKVTTFFLMHQKNICFFIFSLCNSALFLSRTEKKGLREGLRASRVLCFCESHTALEDQRASRLVHTRGSR